MPKIVSISDTHFGISTDGHDNELTGLPTRTEDGLQALDQVINFIIDNKVKLLIHSGDIFDTKTVNQNVINAFYERLKRLSDADVNTYLLFGNHDISSRPTRKSGLEIAKIFDLPNVFVTRGGEILDLGWVQIASVSYWNDIIEISNEVDKVASIIDWTRPAILTVHLQIEYANFPGSFKEDLPFVPLNALIRHPWKFVQAGHIHKPQVLNESPFLFYVGSLTRHSFAEEKDPKGFWLSAVNGNSVHTPVQMLVDCLKMLTLKGTMHDIRAALEGKNSTDFKSTIVRVTIMETEKEDIDTKFLKTIFAEAFKLRILKEPKTKELKKMDAAGLNTLNQYAEKYFDKEPRKNELMALLEEIKKIEESAVV